MSRVRVPVIIFSVFILFSASAAARQVGGRETGKRIFGAGLILGEPTGGTLKLFMGDIMAMQFSNGILFFNRDSIFAALDFVWHPSIIHESKHGILLWYIGVGPGFGIQGPWHHPHDDWDADFAFWVRVPGGACYFFQKVPVEVFAELAPASRFYPFWDFDFFLNTGARYYF